MSHCRFKTAYFPRSSSKLPLEYGLSGCGSEIAMAGFVRPPWQREGGVFGCPYWSKGHVWHNGNGDVSTMWPAEKGRRGIRGLSPQKTGSSAWSPEPTKLQTFRERGTFWFSTFPSGSNATAGKRKPISQSPVSSLACLLPMARR